MRRRQGDESCRTALSDGQSWRVFSLFQDAAAVIVAAGRGTRAGSQELPKQYQPINGKPMFRYSIDAFAQHAGISAIQVVIHPEHRETYLTQTRGLNAPASTA